MAGGNKKNAQKGKKKDRRVAVIPRPPVGVRIGKWLSEYIRCVTTPHLATPTGIPDDDVRPSEKILSWGKGSFATGTTNGFVLCKPGLSSTDGDGTAAQVYYTDATYAGSTFTTTIPTTGVTRSAVNLPYAATSFSGTDAAKLQGRVISSLLRIKPTSTPLTVNGDVVGVASRNNLTLTGLSAATVNLMPESGREAAPSLMGKWFTLRYHPLPANTVYGTTTPEACIGFLATCASNIVWDWEFYNVIEVIGAPSAIRVTPSHCDSTGLNAFWAAQSGKDPYFRPTSAPDTQVLNEVIVRTAGELMEQSCPCPPTAF